MNRLENIITDKDAVIAGLKTQLTKAITRIENGESPLNKQKSMPSTSNENQDNVRQRSKSRESRSEKLKTLTAQNASLQKNIKSYESAVEKLTQMRVEDKREQMAKDKIVEQYLEEIKADHVQQINEFNDYIAELKQGKGIDSSLIS